MKVSVIIPVYNENEILSELVTTLFNTLQDQPYSWEILFIDDGSSDGSYQQLKSIAEENPERCNCSWN